MATKTVLAQIKRTLCEGHARYLCRSLSARAQHMRCISSNVVKRHHRCISTTLTTTIGKEPHIVTSPHPPVDIPDLPFAEFVMSKYSEFGDLKAVLDATSGRTLTFRELKESVFRLGSGLTRLGVRKGDRVLLFSTNCPEYLITMVACSAIGAVISTSNPGYTTSELQRQLEHSKSNTVIVLSDFITTVEQAVKSSEILQHSVKNIIVIGQAYGYRSLATLLEDDGKAFPENVDISSNDVMLIPYSSGTTGLPKGVMLSHRNIIANTLQLNATMRMEPGRDSLLGVLPLFHIYGLVVSQICSTTQGAAYITMPRFIAHDFLTAIKHNQITYLHLVPPLVLYLAKDPIVTDYISSVHTIISGAAPLGKDLCEQLRDQTSASLRQAYGLTETSPVICIDHAPAKLGTVGPLVPNTEAKVVDVASGDDLCRGETGEILTRGPQVMLGYLDNQQATDDMIKNTWLHTGDIGHFDEDGRLTVTDRLKELIKYKGFQVPPAELESLLLAHPGVKDAAVMGIPDEEAGELPKAFVVLQPGQTLSPQDIMDFVKENATSHKQVRGGVTMVDSIPKTPSGKILRRQLKDM
ncbi:uncharacterized protein [Haliotis cracherodii]|uniref:uncharacterized protein n=1 Tax=Haliotis cracherodii TaxID=6455 RepID=UPI0039E7F259